MKRRGHLSAFLAQHLIAGPIRGILSLSLRTLSGEWFYRLVLSPRPSALTDHPEPVIKAAARWSTRSPASRRCLPAPWKPLPGKSHRHTQGVLTLVALQLLIFAGCWFAPPEILPLSLWRKFAQLGAGFFGKAHGLSCTKLNFLYK